MRALALALLLSGCAGKAGIRWVKIPGGTFMMGAEDGDQRPPHRVAIRSFQMARTLVTNKQYKACVAAKACTPAQDHGAAFDGDDQPVVGVDWDQARVFSRWAGGRLPSESEWEYAAKSGGLSRRYPWGDEAATCARAVISQDRPGCGQSATWPVCSKPSGDTRQGLCDMAGNSWEWVQDWYHASYDGAPGEGTAWESPSSGQRVLRGGAWGVEGALAGTTTRHCSEPGNRGNYHGFRPARWGLDKNAAP